METTKLRMRITQTGADGQVHTLPAFAIQSKATIGDFMKIEKTLNHVAADGTKFSLVSWWDEPAEAAEPTEEKVDG